jgi:hypothetical protein
LFDIRKSQEYFMKCFNGVPTSYKLLASAGAALLLSTLTGCSLGFAHVGLASGEGIAVDPSGNVWIANFVAGTGGVEEIVGAATPTVTPIALALHNGTINGKP